MQSDSEIENGGAAEDPFIITMQALSKKYDGVFAVDSLTLQVQKGAIFGFLGHNGAGKTTTVNMLTTLLQPTSGSALVAGFDITNESIEVRKRIGYLPENVQFYDGMTAYENLEFFARLSGMRKPRERILQVLDFLDATEYCEKKMKVFSKGMRQRIGIAQAILHDPKVLFLDEPTSGLDPLGVKQLRETILRLNKERGMTIFMNTHLLSEVMKTCTTIGILSHGRLIRADSLSNILKSFNDESSLEQIYLAIHEGRDEQ
jgi:ABC-2 type transport system ATP-binding protein